LEWLDRGEVYVTCFEVAIMSNEKTTTRRFPFGLSVSLAASSPIEVEPY
jgi:hypothetical protein